MHCVVLGFPVPLLLLLYTGRRPNALFHLLPWETATSKKFNPSQHTIKQLELQMWNHLATRINSPSCQQPPHTMGKKAALTRGCHHPAISRIEHRNIEHLYGVRLVSVFFCHTKLTTWGSVWKVSIHKNRKWVPVRRRRLRRKFRLSALGALF